MQSAYSPTSESTATPERLSSTLATTTSQHGFEIMVPFDADSQDGEYISPDSVQNYARRAKGKAREVTDVSNSDDDDRSLPGCDSPISPGDRIRVYESNCVSQSELVFSIKRKDVTGMDYSMIDFVPNGMPLLNASCSVHL